MASDDSPLDPSILMQLFQQGGMPFPMGGMPPFGMPFGGHTDSETSSDMGRSRKYRDTGMWELQGAMSPFPATIIRTPNPVVPLKFEQEPNRWQGEAEVGYLYSSRDRLPVRPYAHFLFSR